MPENMTDPTTINLGAGGGEPAGPEGEGAQETVVVIIHDLNADTYTVETEAGSNPAASLDEALEGARAALEGGTPDQVRDEVANEVYPTEEGMV